MINRVTKTCACPLCLGQLDKAKEGFSCTVCSAWYPLVQNIPDFLESASGSGTRVQSLSRFYDKASQKYRGSPKSNGYTTPTSFRHRLNIFKHWVDFDTVRQMKILDIGCGTGLMTDTFTRENEVWGVDISSGLLSTARENGLETVRGSAESLPFGANTFDLTVCVGVLPYYDTPDLILSQIARVTRPGGKILVISPADSLFTRSVRALKNLTWKKSRLRQLYLPGQLADAMQMQGIRVLDSCLGYDDQMISCKPNVLPARFRLFSRVAAVFGTLP